MYSIKSKPFGRTVRAELVSMAALVIRRWPQPLSAAEAVESVIDGAKPGTLAGLMKAYALSRSEYSYVRLLCQIERDAK